MAKDDVVADAAAIALSELTDDFEFMVDGKKTTWKEHRQGFIPKSEYTQSRQADTESVRAQVAQQTAVLRQQAEQYAESRAQQMYQQWAYQQAQANQQQQHATATQEQIAASRELGYTTHEHLQPLVDGFQQQIAQLRSENQQVVQTLGLMNQQSQNRYAQYEPLLAQSVTSRLDTTIADAAKRLNINEAGLEGFNDYARNMHAAYTGDDLAESYPGMLDEGWGKQVAAIAAGQKAEVATARRGLSSSGGIATPSAPLDEDLEAGDFWTDEQDSDQGALEALE